MFSVSPGENADETPHHGVTENAEVAQRGLGRNQLWKVNQSFSQRRKGAKPQRNDASRILSFCVLAPLRLCEKNLAQKNKNLRPCITESALQMRRKEIDPMARFDSPLKHVKVAAPCNADWDQMIGNDRARFCGHCNLNVYNLSSMSKSEAGLRWEE